MYVCASGCQRRMDLHVSCLTWVLRTELQASGGAGSARPYCWAVSPEPFIQQKFPPSFMRDIFSLDPEYQIGKLLLYIFER